MTRAFRASLTVLAVLAAIFAVACTTVGGVFPPDILEPPPPPDGRSWLACPTNIAARARGPLGQGSETRLEVQNQSLEVSPTLSPPVNIELVVHRSRTLHVGVYPDGRHVNGGATLQLSLERCPGSIPGSGFLYVYQFRGARMELVDSVSAATVQRGRTIRLPPIEDFSGFSIAS